MDTASSTPCAETSPPRLEPALARELHQPDHRRHYQRLAVFILLYLGAAFAAWRLVSQPGLRPFGWLLAVPCYLCAAGALHGISLFTHEAVHQTLARHARWNAILGAACALPVLQNCSAYTVLHRRHHRHLGEDADPDHYAGYTRWTWLIFTMNWFRLIIGYPIYIVAIPILGWRHGTARQRLGIAVEFIAAALLVTVAVVAPLPAGLLVHGWLIPMLLINFMVNIRGMSQHTLLGESTDEVRGTRSILTSRLIAFFMCNENYHLEHHLYPGVPWYHLPRVHAALREELIVRGAPYIPSYTAFVREFIVHSIRRSPLGRRLAES